VHEASFEKMRAFRNAYLEPSPAPLRVLDVGAGSGEGVLSYRDLFGSGFDYVGLDIEAGPKVDVVPADPFSWELETESFDVVISGQTFEHNPYFWITAAEIARVLSQGGLAAIIAPSKGRVHRFPLDCWRFYPDSWAATCAYVGLELLESFIETPPRDRPIGGATQWHDAMMVARKPIFTDELGEKAFYDRLEAIVATRPTAPLVEPVLGPAAAAYANAHTLERSLPTRLQFWFLRHTPRWMPLRDRVRAHLGQATRARGDAALPWPPR
jgi:SAM-dependent methyltransferase